MWNLWVRRSRHAPRSGIAPLLAGELSATQGLSPAPASGAGSRSQVGRLGDGKGASWRSASGILGSGAERASRQPLQRPISSMRWAIASSSGRAIENRREKDHPSTSGMRSAEPSTPATKDAAGRWELT